MLINVLFYSSLAFANCIISWIHYHIIIQGGFTAPNIPCVPPIHPSLPPSPQSLATTILFVSTVLPFLKSYIMWSYSWNHTLYGLFCLVDAAATALSSFFLLPSFSSPPPPPPPRVHFLLLLNCIVWMYHSLFNHWIAFWLLPILLIMLKVVKTFWCRFLCKHNFQLIWGSP